MYILDEPRYRLHPKDTERFKVLLSLRDLGNTVIVVEHDEDIMKAADMIIDIGPEAGTFGGNLVAQGTYKELLKCDCQPQNILTTRQNSCSKKTKKV
jgi:excinuclease ABC subunit A